jgi:hypothetical protein
LGRRLLCSKPCGKKAGRPGRCLCSLQPSGACGLATSATESLPVVSFWVRSAGGRLRLLCCRPGFRPGVHAVAGERRLIAYAAQGQSCCSGMWLIRLLTCYTRKRTAALRAWSPGEAADAFDAAVNPCDSLRRADVFLWWCTVLVYAGLPKGSLPEFPSGERPFASPLEVYG